MFVLTAGVGQFTSDDKFYSSVNSISNTNNDHHNGAQNESARRRDSCGPLAFVRSFGRPAAREGADSSRADSLSSRPHKAGRVQIELCHVPVRLGNTDTQPDSAGTRTHRRSLASSPSCRPAGAPIESGLHSLLLPITTSGARSPAGRPPCWQLISSPIVLFRSKSLPGSCSSWQTGDFWRRTRRLLTRTRVGVRLFAVGQTRWTHTLATHLCWPVQLHYEIEIGLC
jgi:hypothetical protein